MKRMFKGGIARRCTACLMLAAAGWSIAAIVDDRPNPVLPVSSNHYEALEHYQFSQLPIGHIAEVFSRVH